MSVRNKLKIDNDVGKMALDLFSKGYSNAYITDALNTQGLQIHHTTVWRFLQKYGKVDENADAAAVNGEVVTMDIDLTRIAEKYGITMTEDASTKATLENAETLVNKVFELTTFCLISKLDDYIHGLTRFPKDLYRSYEITFNCLSACYGIRKNDLKKALREIENLNKYDYELQ